MGAGKPGKERGYWEGKVGNGWILLGLMRDQRRECSLETCSRSLLNVAHPAAVYVTLCHNPHPGGER